MKAITVHNLRKQFTTYKRKAGLLNALKSVFNRKGEIKHALKGVSFTINRGEIVGFVGPNGAGKSTTIKTLTGILYPTSGKVDVLGYTPWIDRTKYVANIGVIFGQKGQLWWDLPPIDAFTLSKSMYNIPEDDFKQRITRMAKLLDIEEVMHRPTRQLSLGERMKCEAVMAFLHNPKIVYLDEPTIGLDAIAKEDLRHFLKEINKTEKTTIILTTHDMDDIEELCERIIIIDEGRILYDGDLNLVKKKYVKWQTVDLEFTKVKNQKSLDSAKTKGEIVQEKKHYLSIRFNKEKVDVPHMIEQLMDSLQIVDLKVHEPRLEHVIKEIYRDQ